MQVVAQCRYFQPCQHVMNIPAPTDDVWRPRVTVACVVTSGARYLMVEETIDGESRWNQPAGHLEDHESLTAAAVRETREETGWTVVLTHLVGVHLWRSHEHGDAVIRFTFAASAVHHDPGRPLDTGIQRAIWLTREEIERLGPRLRSPLVLTSIDAWLAGQRLPLSSLGHLSGDLLK